MWILDIQLKPSVPSALTCWAISLTLLSDSGGFLIHCPCHQTHTAISHIENMCVLIITACMKSHTYTVKYMDVQNCSINIALFIKSIERLANGSEGKSAWCQTQELEFHVQYPQGRRKWVLKFSLTYTSKVACKHRWTYRYTHTRTHTHAHTDTHAHTGTHAHTDTNIHTHRHTYTNTHKHTTRVGITNRY